MTSNQRIELTALRAATHTPALDGIGGVGARMRIIYSVVRAVLATAMVVTASSVHHHPGPEAWYTTAGEMCVETPAGKMVGRAGETNIIPADTPVTILATGTEQRRSVWLVLHESAHPWTAPINWTPKGLCKQ